MSRLSRNFGKSEAPSAARDKVIAGIGRSIYDYDLFERGR